MKIYLAFTILFALFYVFALYMTSKKLKELKGMAMVSANWSGGTNIKELKQLLDQTTDMSIIAKAKPVISLINLSKYIMYVIFVTYLVLMAIGV
ncbi:hypothetical protein ABIB62_004238 [Mucilaginibacter sp. UYP25]|uniref:hypothetical protein n=1 Tax=unclassified Mucilaginibacter TaxID=2617802 RepID=UPI0033996F71